MRQHKGAYLAYRPTMHSHWLNEWAKKAWTKNATLPVLLTHPNFLGKHEEVVARPVYSARMQFFWRHIRHQCKSKQGLFGGGITHSSTKAQQRHNLRQAQNHHPKLDLTKRCDEKAQLAVFLDPGKAASLTQTLEKSYLS